MAAPGPALAQMPDAPSAQESSSAPAEASAYAAPEAMFPHFNDTRFWLSGQVNFIFQTHPGFHALYSGKNSLSPHYEKALSRVLTLYSGARVNDSTEFIVALEEFGGTALRPGVRPAENTDRAIGRHAPSTKAPND